MTPLAMAISRALIAFVWQGLIVGLLLWITLAGLRKRSATSRYISSCIALGLMAFIPILTTLLYLRHPSTIANMTLSRQFSQTIAAAASSSPFQLAVWLATLQRWALPAWSFGVVVFSVRLILGYKHAFTLGRRGKPASESIVEVVARLKRLMEVDQRVRVLISSLSDTPSVVGWLRPIILLPAATLMGLTPLQLEAILAHEIGHIKRYDYLVNMLQMLVETLLFYHPAVWWTSKRIRLERELCCDDLAVRFSGNALRYARALTTLEKLRLRAPRVVMASTGGPLLYRIQRLAGVTAKEYGPSRLLAAFAISLGILCFGLNLNWARGQDAPGVQVDLGSSSVIHRTPVAFPETAKKQGITGTVQVELKLDAAGNVADAHVLSGPEELRKAALESVLSWHFTNEAARSTRLVNISFTDQGKQVQVQEPKGAAVAEADKMKVIFVAKQLKLEQAKIGLKEAQNALGERAVFLTQTQSEPTRRQQLEREIGAAQRKLEAAREASPEDRDKIALGLNELKQELEATPFVANIVRVEGRGGRGNLLAGRTLKGIATPGFSESVRGDLLSRLPVREGDLLTQQSLEQAAAAVRSYDEHLRVQFLATGDGQAELRIVAPNERR